MRRARSPVLHSSLLYRHIKSELARRQLLRTTIVLAVFSFAYGTGHQFCRLRPWLLYNTRMYTQMREPSHPGYKAIPWRVRKGLLTPKNPIIIGHFVSPTRLFYPTWLLRRRRSAVIALIQVSKRDTPVPVAFLIVFWQWINKLSSSLTLKNVKKSHIVLLDLENN